MNKKKIFILLCLFCLKLRAKVRLHFQHEICKYECLVVYCYLLKTKIPSNKNNKNN